MLADPDATQAYAEADLFGDVSDDEDKATEQRMYMPYTHVM